MIRRLIAALALASLVVGPAADAQFRSRAAPGRSVGLRLLVLAGGLGPELMPDGAFNSSTSWVGQIQDTQCDYAIPYWTSGSWVLPTCAEGWTRSVSYNGLNVNVVNGATYRVSIRVIAGGANCTVGVPGGERTIPDPASPGIYSWDVVSNTTSFRQYINCAFYAVQQSQFDDYSIRRVS